MFGLFEDIGTGGPIIALLAVLSLFSLTVIAMKTIELWSVTSGSGTREAAIEKFAGGDRAGAIAIASAGRAPADRVFAYAAQALTDGLSGQPLMTELMRRGNDEFARMNRHIQFLELIAMISPLLGLLGTVLGMIQSFQELELAQGAANASVLAGGIWQALLTTAAGLLVAIPAAVGASLLSSRAERGAQMIEGAVAQLMLSAERQAG
ncbi:MAG: MotA/TolQ/ExbB proton channel family protein [Sulfitobacter sp.]|nr:MotA/TolQ/ExbB proton channel family protein [Sulfitobacter sp.]